MYLFLDGANFSLLVENDVRVSLANVIDRDANLVNEIADFLLARTTTNLKEGLDKFPTIKKLFFKFNCIRSSEAICERIFSYAGM